MTFTAGDISEYVDEQYGSEFWSEVDDFGKRGRWDLQKEYPLVLMGTTHFATGVETFGGEGQGDERWVVFEVDGRLFKKDGYYASYDGTTWDGDVYEVEQYEKTVTDYRKVK